MKSNIKYRGRIVTDQDVVFIERLIAENPTASRRRLSQLLCEAWDWRQANGALKDMVCRGLMLQLHRSGLIELPAPRQKSRNPLANRKMPSTDIEIDDTPIRAKLSEILPLGIRQVRRTSDEGLFNGLIHRFHYLEYTQPVGEHLKYVMYAGDRPVACMAWASPARRIGCRDRFIGWPKEVRQENIHFIAYNARFLILPFVEVKFLASHILGRMAKILPADWERIYGHPIYFLETFVDSERFKGTCYRAANWTYLGMTTGRGKDDQIGKPNRSLKEVLCYPLGKRFRGKMCETGDGA